MALFTTDFLHFFEELSQNNHKDWFHKNKRRYENAVKRPFETLVGELIEKIRPYDPDLLITPKDAILRINRDIRFSQDKAPYNTYVTAFISRGGRKDKSIPGFFIRLSPDMLGIMTGCYGPDKAQLNLIREAILQQPDRWHSISTAPSFREKLGDVKGETNKRLPAPFAEASDRLPILANKQFYTLTELPAQSILSEMLSDDLMEYWHTAYPFNQFLLNAITQQYV
ncbi:MAG: DUF2461 domain-containing protein [Saprospiraceae bacterium]